MKERRCISGPGKSIAENIYKPLLKKSDQYDRVTSFYNPESLFILLKELAEVWEKGGSIRLIIGYHQSVEIMPAINDKVRVKEEIKKAVANLMRGSIDEILKKKETQFKEIYPIIQELIKKGGLQVRLVTPKINFDYYKKNKKWPKQEKAIFHSKFAIFHYKEKKENTIKNRINKFMNRIKNNIFYYKPSKQRLMDEEDFAVVTGSFNESKGGFGENIEDAILHRSWEKGEREVACYFLDRFEKLWIDGTKDVKSMPFNEEFKEVIEEADKKSERKILDWKSFYNTIEGSPSYTPLCLPNIGLLPHQFRAYNKALKRWPIRALLSDEVGLGKTIEAGAVIYYLIKHFNIKKTMILVPASLRKKWQEDLKSLFNLEFWIYNPSDGTCTYNGRSKNVGENPLSINNHVIVSWHWARLDASREGSRFNEKYLPEVLVVDEAHHARIKNTNSEDDKRTKLYDLLYFLQKKIPHMLLLTATPYQTGLLDYYSLLNLLGLPKDFDIKKLEQFSKYTKGEIHKNRFSSEVRKIRQINKTLESYSINPQEDIIQKIKKIDNKPENFEDLARKDPIPDNLFLKYHPTTLFTIRSTRSSLKKQGYEFPKVNLSGSDIQIEKKQKEWFNDLENFISKRLGKTESTLSTNKKVGLMRSLYRQRVVSSIQAAIDTLNRREKLLNKFIESKDPTYLRGTLGKEFKSDDNDPSEKDPNINYKSENKRRLETLIEKGRNEKYHIDRLITKINENFVRNGKIYDPKLKKLKEKIEKHLEEKRKILVFSRFTSTTKAVIKELSYLADSVGLGRFDGEKIGTYNCKGKEIIFNKCSREEIISHLKSGKINVLVCSDAASEGLDLYSANVLINIDIPWNPARLLQRFGRIDRLGQKANNVYLINMYYPNTIEEKMYSVLEERRVDFRSLLGEVPDILSNQQTEIINKYGDGSKPKINLTIEKIEKARQTYHDNQFDHLEFKEKTNESEKDIYTYLIDSIIRSEKGNRDLKQIGDKEYKIGKRKISPLPFSDYFLPWNKGFIKEFEEPRKENGKKAKILELNDERGDVLGIVAKYGNDIFPLSTREWPMIFDFIFNGKAISKKDLIRFNIKETEEAYKHIIRNDRIFIPNHNFIKTISNIRPKLEKKHKIKLGEHVGDITIKSE